jgi:hypothetical protein
MGRTCSTYGGDKSMQKILGAGIVYGMDDGGFESRQGLRIFLSTTASRPALGTTQPPIQ